MAWYWWVLIGCAAAAALAYIALLSLMSALGFFDEGSEDSEDPPSEIEMQYLNEVQSTSCNGSVSI